LPGAESRARRFGNYCVRGGVMVLSWRSVMRSSSAPTRVMRD